MHIKTLRCFYSIYSPRKGFRVSRMAFLMFQLRWNLVGGWVLWTWHIGIDWCLELQVGQLHPFLNWWDKAFCTYRISFCETHILSSVLKWYESLFFFNHPQEVLFFFIGFIHTGLYSSLETFILCAICLQLRSCTDTLASLDRTTQPTLEAALTDLEMPFLDLRGCWTAPKFHHKIGCQKCYILKGRSR